MGHSYSTFIQINNFIYKSYMQQPISYDSKKGTSQKYYDERISQDFQASLEEQKIEKIWRTFRESGNSTEGRIIKTNFKRIFIRFYDKNEGLIDALFERFKLDRNFQTKNDKQQIDIQDLAISLAILARIPYENKLKFIFSLSDVDEDGCLSIQQIYKMIIRIEKNFSKQNSLANIQSALLLYQIALKKAQRTYRQIVNLLKSNNPQLAQDENNLITCDQFIEALKKSEQFYNEQKFLPRIFSLHQILKNIPTEFSIQINEANKQQFIDFRKQIYTILKSNEIKQNLQIRYPGKIEIIKDQKVIEIMSPYQKVVEKKNKNEGKTGKFKANQIKTNVIEQKKQAMEQKNPDQTLQSYKNKLKKMIQTKLDPRLNIHFDKPNPK